MARRVLCLLTLVALGSGITSPLARAQDPVPPAATAQTKIVRSIVVVGAQRYTEQQLVDALGAKIGEPLDPTRIDESLKALEHAFKVRGSVQYRDVDGGIELQLSVVEMLLDLEPRFIGNKQIAVETLRKWAQLDEKTELYLYQANRVRQRLIEGYRQEGYYFAEVDVVKRGDDIAVGVPGAAGAEAPDVIFEIREGPQVRVKDVLITGNHSLPESGALWWRDGLTHLAKTDLGGPWLFNWHGSKFVEEVLDADVLSMRNVYRDQGFLDAVVELEPLEFSPDRSGVKIHVVVDEGQPYTISSLRIQGIERSEDPKLREPVETPVALLFPEPELLRLCKAGRGKRFLRAVQDTDASALRAHYGKQGYLSHPTLPQLDSFLFLEPELVFDPLKHAVAVTYRLQQGRKRFVREVLFDGSEYTRDRVLRREIDVLPGQIAEIEEVNRSLGRLYSTNYFNDDMRPLEHKDPTFRFLGVPGNPDWVDLEFVVEEGRVVDFQIQGGVDSNNGLFGRISLAIRNFDIAALPDNPWETFGDIYDKQAFHGAGQLLQLEYSPGTIQDYERIRFVEPDIFRRQFDRYGLDIDLSHHTRDWRFYNEDRAERTLKLKREFGRNLSVSLGYTNQEITVDRIRATFDAIIQPDDPPLPKGIFEEQGRSRLDGLLFDVAYRKIDNYINPHEGLAWSFKNGVYGGALGGDWQFVKSSVEVDCFVPVGSSEQEVRSGFHFGLGAGIADASGGSSDVPYTERFFLGGYKQLRGFAFRGVGPNIGGEPIGGSTMLNGTAEYSIPLYTQVQPGTYKRLEVFRMVIFADAGVLDPKPWQVDFSQLRASVGFGIGLAYPIPLTFSFGFPVRSGEGDRKQVFAFAISAFSF